MEPLSGLSIIEKMLKLIDEDQDRQDLRTLLLEGEKSAPTLPIRDADFEALRERVNRHQ